MRMSRFHAPTLREAPKEAELPSHALLLRAGALRQLTAGIYDLLPLGLKSVRKIERIIREEMDRAGAQEVLLPAVQPAELWQESGRWDKYGPELLRFTDRKSNAYCLGPTHEEVIVDLVRRDVRSYKQLPLNLYQVQFKFRDEVRPRGGLMRGREFIMKDAYSFDTDFTAARASYQAMFDAYGAIFRRCGLDFRPVEADAGNIGGSTTHEFQVLAETGEDAIVSCSHCGYAANVELARIGLGTPPPPAAAATPAPTEVATPGMRTVAEVTAFLDVAATALMKTLIVVADGVPHAAIVRGDRELNLIKVRAALGAAEVALADDETVTRVTGAPVGFAGPIDLDLPTLVDHEIAGLVDAVCGANAADAHYTGVAVGRDFTPTRVADLRVAGADDPCPECAGGVLRTFRGIEVGHVFLLGTRYSEPMGCTFLDADGKSQPMVMGCYGIGVTRIMAAAIEQSHDDKGIIWPMSIAPFHVAVVPLGKPGDDVSAAAEGLYSQLGAAGLDVIVDDRKERPGVKMADAELMGFPLQVVLGRRALDEGVAELKDRRTGATDRVPLGELVAVVRERVRAALSTQTPA
jgi:prolyl-tRNA synthetase